MIIESGCRRRFCGCGGRGRLWKPLEIREAGKPVQPVAKGEHREGRGGSRSTDGVFGKFGGNKRVGCVISCGYSSTTSRRFNWELDCAKIEL